MSRWRNELCILIALFASVASINNAAHSATITQSFEKNSTPSFVNPEILRFDDRLGVLNSVDIILETNTKFYAEVYSPILNSDLRAQFYGGVNYNVFTSNTGQGHIGEQSFSFFSYLSTTDNITIFPIQEFGDLQIFTITGQNDLECYIASSILCYDNPINNEPKLYFDVSTGLAFEVFGFGASQASINLFELDTLSVVKIVYNFSPISSVPEIDTWIQIIFGLSCVGILLRRQRYRFALVAKQRLCGGPHSTA